MVGASPPSRCGPSRCQVDQVARSTRAHAGHHRRRRRDARARSLRRVGAGLGPAAAHRARARRCGGEGQPSSRRLVPADAPLLDPRARAELAAALEAARGRASARRRRARSRRRQRSHARAIVLARREQLVEAGLGRAKSSTPRRPRVTAAESHSGRRVRRRPGALPGELARARLQSPSAAGGRPIDVRSPADGVVLKRVRESEAVVPAGRAAARDRRSGAAEIVSDLLSTDAVRVAAGRRGSSSSGAAAAARRPRAAGRAVGLHEVSALGVEEQRVNVIIDFVDPSRRPRARRRLSRRGAHRDLARRRGADTSPVGSLVPPAARVGGIRGRRRARAGSEAWSLVSATATGEIIKGLSARRARHPSPAATR